MPCSFKGVGVVLWEERWHSMGAVIQIGAKCTHNEPKYPGPSVIPPFG